MVGDFGWEHEGRKSRVGAVKEYGLMSPDATRDFVLFKLHKLFNFSIKVSKNKFS